MGVVVVVVMLIVVLLSKALSMARVNGITQFRVLHGCSAYGIPAGFT